MIAKTVTLTKTFVVNESNAVEILSLVQDGFSIKPVATPAPATNGVRAVKRVVVASHVRGVGAGRKRRKARKQWSEEDRKKMAELRASGLTYRIIGKRYGITDGRAWQIIHGHKKAKGVKA